MRFIRSIIVFLYTAASVVPVATALLVISLFVNSHRLWWLFVRPWLASVIWVARWVGGVRYRIRGLENLPERSDNQRIILCAKHQSTWETFFFPSMMPHPLAYVFKRELLRIPFFGWSMARLEMVHIDRSARSEAWNKVATLGVQLMDRGKWIIMFPEGTRAPRGGQGDYKTGASRLAVATGASVIPIAVASGRCWPRRTWRFIPGTIDVSIGEPIKPLPDQSPSELMVQIEDWIEREMRLIDAEAYPDSDPIKQAIERGRKAEFLRASSYEAPDFDSAETSTDEDTR
ncbi:phospholipid/glycerol acyltransferase [Luminiphilus syltensis NOR5-1B]|uniref:Phospholipid/glycerol acyltransferase n=1 Tax=Luminiphilus syltensis NOR5-1B TaxID=565045 RepID=B8KYC3_9GAMM|nr:lysophospholipid acyltransferase family protein [Luminiphilus syltensis]EED34638.1 phospholipid/glycerol acyltransferase [Luminiphilus syltensis NOR5-1B]